LNTLEDGEEYEDAQHQLSPRNQSPRAQPSTNPPNTIADTTIVLGDPGPSQWSAGGVSFQLL
jgi:hypothetical protein